MARDLTGVLDAVIAGIVVLDAGGRVEIVNSAACRILESSAEAVRGKPVEALLGPEHSLARLSRSVFETGRSAAETGCPVQRRLDQDLAVDVAASPLFGAGGGTDGVVLVLRDSTIQRRLQQVVSEREHLSAFGRIAAGVAHEVKNPLGGIRGAAEILAARAAGDPKTRDAAELIVREVDRIATLVDDLMAFTHGPAARLSPFNIHRILDGVLDLLAMDPLSRGVEVERNYDPSIPEVMLDRDRMTQVFLNLVRNALQAMEAKPGRLAISTRMDLDRRLTTPEGEQYPTLRIELADTGPGIPEELLEELATPFFTTRPGGTGLGLALARHWVARHQGTLRISSHPGHGTQVHVLLPLEDRGMSEPARVLVADDEPSIRFVLRETLEEEGCHVVEVEDGDRALQELETGGFQIAFLDIRMPGLSGLELLDRLKAMGSTVAVVIITAQNTFENAVEAMKRGALDYLVKPFGVAEVKALVSKAGRARTLQREVDELRREVGRRTVPGDRLVGKSPELLEIFKTVGRVAARDVSVLITGESGTGKELVARAIHAASRRADGPFVAVNTAAIPRELLESELFGHERGAFTGAVESRTGRFREASGGTLFLDEIGDMPVDLQAKLLRVLQSDEVTPVGGRKAVPVDVRIIAATHRNLDEAVAEGRFREDLLYRLRVVPLHIPALRERRDDIPVLARHFVDRYAEPLAGGPRLLDDTTLARLSTYAWPGNVRELENAIKRALVLASGEVLLVDDFAFLDEGPSRAGEGAALGGLVRAEAERALADGGENVYRDVLERVERPLLEAVLERTDGNQIRAAALLGINRNTLRKKIVELGIELPGRD